MKKRGRPRSPCNELEIAARRANARTPRARSRSRPVKRWKGTELEALRLAYEGVFRINDVAAAFSTSRGAICILARRHGWKMRRPSSIKVVA